MPTIFLKKGFPKLKIRGRIHPVKLKATTFLKESCASPSGGKGVTKNMVYEEEYEGARKDFVKEYVEDVNKEGLYHVEYTRTTRFEAVNYLAVKNVQTGVVSGVVFLVAQKSGENGAKEIAYQIIKETDAPEHYDAGKKLVDMLSPTEDAKALEWRQKCLEAHEARRAKERAKRAAKKATEGADDSDKAATEE